MNKRHEPAGTAKKDVLQQIIDRMPSASDEIRVDAKQVEKFVGALEEFIAAVQPALQRRKMTTEALHLSAGRAGTSDWLQRVVAGTVRR